VAPEAVVGSQLHYLPSSQDVVQRGWTDITDRLFGILMERPTNYLSRSPTFKQEYWNRVRELLPFADESAQAQMLRRGRAESIPGFGSRASRRSGRLPRAQRTTEA